MRPPAEGAPPGPQGLLDKLTSANVFPIGIPSTDYGKLPILASAILLYSRDMRTFEILWRGAVLLLLTFLTWNYFVTGAILGGMLLGLCVPVWLYITLYSLNFI